MTAEEDHHERLHRAGWTLSRASSGTWFVSSIVFLGAKMQHAELPLDTWRRAAIIAGLWVVLAGTGAFVLDVFIVITALYPATYFIQGVLTILVLTMPIALGQWYGSWKVAWLTLAFEVVFFAFSLLIVVGWAMLNFASPR